MKYRFLADYRHRWPSRAHTEYKAGMVMTLPRAVIAAAGDLIEPVRVGRVLNEDETQDRLIAAAPKPTRTRRRVTDGK